MSEVSFKDALKFWVKLGFISFGGPAGQIAIMQQELVEKSRWISQPQFSRALNFCMILPGPEAQQLATYMGWRLHGILGGVLAGSFFVLPSVFLIMFLSWLAASQLEIPAIAGALFGVQPVVVAVVLMAVVKIAQKSLRHPAMYLFPLASFLAVSLAGISFPWVVLAAALGGVILHRFWPQTSCLGTWEPESKTCVLGQEEAGPDTPAPGLSYVLKTALVFALLWAAPFLILLAWRGWGDVLVQEAIFFTKAALVTFGGAYAVLSYIADFSVNHGWLTAQQMLIGLGLAESTPGPLIMVTQYVGFLGGWTQAGQNPQLVNAVLGGLITTYVTFLPCFFFIFAGAPYIETLSGNPRLQAALGGVTAAVVGVVLNLGVFFGRKVLIAQEGGLDWFALAVMGISLLLLNRLKLPLHAVIGLGALAGMLRAII